MDSKITDRWGKASVALKDDALVNGLDGLATLEYVHRCAEIDLWVAVRRLRHPEPGRDGITPRPTSWRDIAAALRLPVSTAYARYRDV